MTEAGHTARSLAEALGIDPKTVERWISTGRVPHRSNAHTAALVLGKDAAHLWPSLRTKTRNGSVTHEELVAVYARRSDVPLGTWRSMFERAQEAIEVLVYAALFLHEQIPDWNDLLRARAAAGCRVRVLIGAPDSEAVRVRGGEERFGHGIESRCRLARLHYAPLVGAKGIEVAQHSTVLYNSVYRADDELLANTHVYGATAYANPVFHLRNGHAPGLFTTYAESFDAVWKTAAPIRKRPPWPVPSTTTIPPRPCPTARSWPPVPPCSTRRDDC
ncbi:helix-turn-helix domain-containing protein [Thermobifida halotolerans]|uniref:helix-turn-helix domain-containing protein n=1 Tax=Thermobifida halotolerans TaxID=483545 RepID=UPI001F2EFA8B|nr:helix-turn-helix domain-containing protein [Thermobifida halotolerans]